MLERILIANRGEVAVRVARTARDRGSQTVAVFTADDADSLHRVRADRTVELPGSGIAGYLDAAAIIAAAKETDAQLVHPGWGFLAENASFAERCAQAGLRFVGPTPEHLRLFGDKVAARALAVRCGVPVLEASGVLREEHALHSFRDGLGGAAILIKAVAGGGGRGMHPLPSGAEAGTALRRCTGEAAAAFGNGDVYAERYLERARHIEVQIVGDGRGGVTHLWERDCTLQRRYQKLIEIAPAPHLAADVRRRVLEAALAMAREVGYRGLGTFEFLVDAEQGAHYFIEANPRLQVEHTVTEAILGIDLVALQLDIAGGATLPDLDLAGPPPPPSGFAMELRINAESLLPDGAIRPADGALQRFEPAAGPGVRVDSAAHPGYRPHPAFDSLLAKLVVHEPRAGFAALLRRAARAAAEFVAEGTETNLSALRALLALPEIEGAQFHTGFVEAQAERICAAAARLEPAPASGNRGGRATSPTDAGRAPLVPSVPPGCVPVSAPVRGSLVGYEVAIGERVRRGQALAVLESMKMHYVVEAPVAGVVQGLPAAGQGTVAEHAPLLYLAPVEDADARDELAAEVDLDTPRADLEEVFARHRYGLDENRPQAVARRRKIGSRTARENVADLCDPDSFVEYGALAIAAQRRRRSVADLMEATPADGMIAGIGTVNAPQFGDEAARCAVLAYDYTVLAGTQGHTNHKKKDRLFELVEEWALPTVFFTEGGGGRPGDVDTDDLIMGWLDLKTFTTWAQTSGLAPRIAVNSGRCFAGNAVVFGCADITVATESSNIGLAGPAMIAGGGLGQFAPEDIGPIDVQTRNGVVDLACRDEAEATALARQLLGYFQGALPDWSCADQRRLRHLIPENRLHVYDIDAVIRTLADEGSVVELRPSYGVGVVTAFVRIEGRPFGLIANDPKHLGGAIDGEGGEKGAHFLQLCDAFGLPIVSLCDTPGFMVGPDSEMTAAVRRGSRLMVASANLNVPLFAVVLRKAYGLGAQAMVGGGFHRPFFSIAWPTAEFGPMGLEGAVELGYRKELEAIPDADARAKLYDELVAKMYDKGKGVSVAQVFEVDAVIDPSQTRAWLVRGLRSAGKPRRGARRYVDVW